MINKLFIIFILVFSFCKLETASAQIEKRIQFAKGKISAVVNGMTGAEGIYYKVRAKGGQKVNLELSPENNVGIKVEKEGAYGHEVLLREEHGGTYDIYLEENGDISIFLGSISGKSIPYSLTVKISQSRGSDI